MRWSPLSDNTICEAGIWALHIHRLNSERQLRAFLPEDVKVIRVAMRDIQSGWQVYKNEPKEPHQKRLNYKEWRDKRLKELQSEHSWCDRTRNLYASMHSIILSWKRNGRNLDTEKQLSDLLYGAELFLQYFPGYQPRLTGA